MEANNAIKYFSCKNEKNITDLLPPNFVIIIIGILAKLYSGEHWLTVSLRKW